MKFCTKNYFNGLSTAILLFVFATAGAQETEKANFRLKDGSIIKGDVIHATNEFIRVVLITGDTVNVKYDLIGVGEEKTPPKNYTRPVDLRNSKKERRKAKRAESALRRNKRKYLADAHLGIFSPEESPAEMSLFGGYKVTNDFAVGLLVNYGVYEIRFDEPEFVGVMPAIRYQLSTEEKGTRFYAEMAAGIAVPSNNEQFGEDFIRDRSIGLSLRPSIGLRFVTERTTMFSFALAARYLSHSAFISDSDFGNPGQVITQQYSKKYILPTLTFGFGF